MSQKQIKFVFESSSSDSEEEFQFTNLIRKIVKQKQKYEWNKQVQEYISQSDIPVDIKNSLVNSKITHCSNLSLVLQIIQQKDKLIQQKQKRIVKIYRSIQLLEHQIFLLKKIPHQNILQVITYFPKGFQSYFYGVTISKLIKPYDFGFRISQQVIKQIMNQILEAIEYIHKSGIIHGDIKPQNILVTYTGSQEPKGQQLYFNQINLKTTHNYFIQDQFDIFNSIYSNKLENLRVTVIDFGNSFQFQQFSRQIIIQKTNKSIPLGHKQIFSPTQTILYRSPESIYYRGCFEIDIWGIGHILFQLVVGQKLIQNQQISQKQLQKYFQSEENWENYIQYRLKKCSYFNQIQGFKKIIINCLKVKKDQRIQIQTIKKFLYQANSK